jgi:hypothetical protein
VNLRRVTNLELKWERLEGGVLALFLGMWKNYFCQLLDIHRADVVRQIEVT